MLLKNISFILSTYRENNPVFSSIPSEFGVFEATGCAGESPVFDITDLQKLSVFIQTHAGRPILGYIGYDFKNELHPHLSNAPPAGFPDIFLFCPDTFSQSGSSPHLRSITELEVPPITLKADMTREIYLQKVKQIQEHITAGDMYELNFCISFQAEQVFSEASIFWERLQHISPMPFSAFFDHPERAIISASPERFMKKKGNRLFIQPMKGTQKRSPVEKEDKELRDALYTNEKERSENVMIVDLTRNDLSKIAEKGSVKVEELFGIYSFPNVHQMVSTVSCELKKETSFTEILSAVFPMGSMTGAPKLRAMQLIEKFETKPRGPFSGMLGYIDPTGDFDFNVLIRTLFYNKKDHTLSLSVGSAITAKSDPEKEYEECFIKLRPMLEALNARIIS